MSRPVRHLYRSRTDTQIAGLCGGLGAYLEVDPILVRLIAVAVTIFTGIAPGLLTYLAGWLIVPLEPLPLPASSPPAPAEPPRHPA